MKSLALISIALLAAVFCSAAGDSLQWGSAADGLRMGIGFGPSTPDPQVRLVFENTSAPQIDVPLGSTSDKGPIYDLEFTLTAPDGKKEYSIFNMNGPPGVQKAVQPILAQIKKGGRYEILLSMKKFVYLDNGKERTLQEMLAMHYSMHATIDTTADARSNHVRGQWLGKIMSGELRQ
jgi:hypothetical protein